MKTYNLIVVFNTELNKVLMCKRMKEPYKGLYNFPGGKVEENEDYYSSCKRELWEETGLDIEIKPVFTTEYFYEQQENIKLVVYCGISNSMDVKAELNPLEWLDINRNFSYDMFAGEGNCEHILRCALLRIFE